MKPLLIPLFGCLASWAGVLLVDLAILCGITAAAQAQPADSTAARSSEPKRVGLAVQQTMLSNLVVNRAASLMGEELKHDMSVDFETWSRNLRLGWTWDEEGFLVNMFGHPYQGAAYFNAGRSNGLSYWESAPLVVFGSWTWEYFGESLRPSLNDFFTTTFGGIAVGELTYRVAAIIRDERARGIERVVREMAALVVNPVGGFNRLVRGEWARVGPNPPEHDPGDLFIGVSAGVRYVYEDTEGMEEGHVTPTLLLDVGYGDPFERSYQKPFDVFSAHVQVSTGLNVLQTSGRLYQTGLPWGRALAVSHRLDYFDNPAYQFGGQSVEVGLLSRFTLPRGFSLRTRLGGSALIMGAVSAPPSAPPSVLPGSAAEGAYDIGPGLGSVLNVVLVRGGTPYLTLYSRAEYLHSVSGTPADHTVAFAGLRGAYLSGVGSASGSTSAATHAPAGTRTAPISPGGF